MANKVITVKISTNEYNGQIRIIEMEGTDGPEYRAVCCDLARTYLKVSMEKALKKIVDAAIKRKKSLEDSIVRIELEGEDQAQETLLLGNDTLCFLLAIAPADSTRDPVHFLELVKVFIHQHTKRASQKQTSEKMPRITKSGKTLPSATLESPLPAPRQTEKRKALPPKEQQDAKKCKLDSPPETPEPRTEDDDIVSLLTENKRLLNSVATAILNDAQSARDTLLGELRSWKKMEQPSDVHGKIIDIITTFLSNPLEKVEKIAPELDAFQVLPSKALLKALDDSLATVDDAAATPTPTGQAEADKEEHVTNEHSYDPDQLHQPGQN